jgi:hypothetical protein
MRRSRSYAAVLLATAYAIAGCAGLPTETYVLSSDPITVHVAERVVVQEAWEARGMKGKVYGFACPVEREIWVRYEPGTAHADWDVLGHEMLHLTGWRH